MIFSDAGADKDRSSSLPGAKFLKTVVGITLGLIIIVFMPIFALLSVFGGVENADYSSIYDSIMANMDADQLATLQQIDATLTEIEASMISAGYSHARVTEAHVLYTVVLYNQSQDSDFADKLVGCFAPEQTDAQLVAAVNSTFGVNITETEFTKFMSLIRAVYIDSSDYIDPATKNNLDRVQWAIHAKDRNWGYVWGTYGKVLDNALFKAKLEQYPDNVGAYEDFIRAHWVGRRTADCIGLIKGYCWFDPVTMQIQYAANDVPDMDSDYMAGSAAEQGSIDTLPEIPGLAVWRSGHIGIYIGDGKVIEAKGTQIGVVETELSEGSWTHWIKIPYIDYIEETTEPEEPEPIEPLEPDGPAPPEPVEP